MELQTFFDNFEVMAEAPNGVTELREAILKLACTGKLVPQQSEEGTSVELIERIAKRLSQVRKGKNRRLPTEEIEDSKGVPLGWTRAYLGEIVDFQYGKGLAKKERDDNGLIPVYGSNGIVGRHSDALISEPALVIGRKGSCGAVNLAPDPFWPIDTTYFVIPDMGLEIRFLYLLIRSLNLGELDKSTAIPGLNRNDAYLKIVDIPPTAEQKRIVAKVDQLMALCDELEEKKEKRNKYRVRANEASLDKLLNAQEPEEFEEHWQRVVENFEQFVTSSDDIAQLQSLLTHLACSGRLDTSNDSDEPASYLLKKILGEKSSRKRSCVEGSFAIPSSWEWAKMEELTKKIHYGYTASSDPSISDVRLLRITDIKKNGQVDWDTVPGCVIEEDKISSYELQNGDLLIARTGGTIGKSFLVFDVDCRAVFASYLIRLIPSEHVNPNFLRLFCDSPYYWKQLYSKTSGTGQPNVNGRSLGSLLVPFPPLEEQNRIVERLQSLQRNCLLLEQRLSERERSSQTFSSAITSFVGGLNG